MLLEFQSWPVLANGLLLLVLYLATQRGAGAITKLTVSECDVARPRLPDAIALLLFYVLIMYLRSIAIERMMLPYDIEEQGDLYSGALLGGVIAIAFLTCRLMNLGHIFPDKTPDERPDSITRIFRIIAMVAVILVALIDLVQLRPMRGRLTIVPWFVFPRVAVIVGWFLLSFVLPVRGGKRRLILRSYLFAVVFALLFVRPSFPSVLVLGILLGILTHEMAAYGVQPLFGAFQQNPKTKRREYVCPYNKGQQS